ncbi:MAG: glycosyltransferase family 2 protein [Candidatus Gastranaerophilales bacterium]|nr:glycosyltransferase family 2 protein [Candidatus Gastranaerophilales bacterium]MCM1073830.1 glycosyltransferase family 2 protein [Bacteroides sp.]
MTQDLLKLDQEFNKIWTKLENGENFTLLRYGDGEMAIMQGRQVKAQEGWCSPKSDIPNSLGLALLDTFNLEGDNIYFGISCPCCDNAAYYFYSSRIKSKNLTFANMFVNCNFSKFKNDFYNLKRDAVLIANYRAKGHKIGNLNILKHYEINDDCVNFWETQASDLIKQIKEEFGDKNDLLYVVSAGPMAEPIIAELYKNNPNNCYIDFGSSTDIFYRENISRPYMIEGNYYAEKCCWMHSPNDKCEVSVVLNLYKRPENLKLQLEALEKQTLKPKEVLLYQDGTSDTIEIPEEVKNKFNIIEISPVNKGVWARFDFARRKAGAEYVCVFDDDTIPGNRWLENCITEMRKQEGLYVTIGILMEKPEEYPFSNYGRLGWAVNIDNTREVDFGGHSWFFKKEWLNYLFEDSPQKVQEYKLAAEDMAFSFALQKHNIKTFVPPHPSDQKELFGSIPKLAWDLGTTKLAVSSSKNNLQQMNEAVKILLDNGWETLSQKDMKYVKQMRHYERKNRYKNSFIENIFSIKNAYRGSVKRKVITLLGIKFRFKVHS